MTTDRSPESPTNVAEIYGERYADIYRALYVDHPMWAAKHEWNLRILSALLRPGCSWLDTCCGQAWHFARVGDSVRRTGIDLSAAQLARARRDCPGASFHQADVLAVDLGGERFDVVTNFWGSYSYLDDEGRIEALLERLVEWTEPGGVLYLELITPAAVAAFNETPFSDEHHSMAILRAEDGVRWSYRDAGGRHDLTSPPPAWFVERLTPRFARVEIVGVVSTMQQLVASGRHVAQRLPLHSAP